MINGKKVGLCLGSGGARGLAHVGVLQVLEENGIIPDVISGCSAGAIFGAIYAAGTNLYLLEKYLGTVDAKTIIDLGIPIQGGFLSGDKIEEVVMTLTHDLSFGETRIPFLCIATDLVSGEMKVFEEGYAAVHLVGDAVALEDHLEDAALCVGPVEDGEAVVPAAHAAAVQDAVADVHRFLPFRPALVDRDGEAVRLLRPQPLALAAAVVFDDPVGRLQNLVRGAIVLLQPHHVGPGEVLLEFQDVADVRAAPAVDALVVVAHHAQVPMLISQAAPKTPPSVTSCMA